MKILLRTGFGLLVLGLLWLVTVASGWLPRPSAAQLTALEALRPEPPNISGARNALELLYSFDYDVPESEWAAVASADIEAYERRAVAGAEQPAFEMLANTPWPPYPKTPNEHPALCSPWASDCLPRVRHNLDAAREFVALGQKRLVRGDQLAGYDHFRSTVEPQMDSPIPVAAGGYFPLLLTAVALDHIDGQHDRAFARLCAATADWRRLRSHTDILIVDMLGLAQMAGASRLYAEMLGELPGAVAPPCPEVFAPLSDAELNQCASFRSEFHLFRNTLRDAPRFQLLDYLGGSLGVDGLLPDLLWNREHSIRMIAAATGAYCGQPHRERIATRSVAPLPNPPPCNAMAWIFDPVSCSTAPHFMPSYDDYYRRAIDIDGRLRLLGTAMWLRQRGDGDTRSAFATRPAELHSAQHDFTLDADTGVVRMRPHDRKRGDYWEFSYLPAPAAALP